MFCILSLSFFFFCVFYRCHLISLNFISSKTAFFCYGLRPCAAWVCLSPHVRICCSPPLPPFTGIALFLMPCNRLKRYIIFLYCCSRLFCRGENSPSYLFNLAESNQLCNTLSVFLFAKLIKYLWMFLYWREKNSRWRSPRSQSHFRNACACQSGAKKGSLAKKEWGGEEGENLMTLSHSKTLRPKGPN